MAGAGYKLFATGDVLTAAQVNTYLQEQVVMVFANAAARTTALSSVLAEGMVTYLKDTDALEIYSGSAWVGYGSGDITGITTGATSGLTGGVTSGTADLKLNTTAKGGLLVGTGSGTASELTVGANNTILTADSSTATGLKWATASSGALVLTGSSDFTTSSSIVISNCFSSTYDFYMMYLDLSAVSSSDIGIAIKMRSGSTSASTNYNVNKIEFTGTTTTASQSLSATSLEVGYGSNTNATRNGFICEFIDPGIARATKILARNRSLSNSGTGYGKVIIGEHNTATAYDSLEIIPEAGTISGTARVYGYAKS